MGAKMYPPIIYPSNPPNGIKSVNTNSNSVMMESVGMNGLKEKAKVAVK